MFCTAKSFERLCWCAWPCEKCSGGLTAIGHIVKCLNSSQVVFSDIPEEIAKIQISWLLDWVRKCNHQAPIEMSLPRVAEGSEHVVFLDSEKAQVYKCTRRGIFGESYYLEDDHIKQRNCSPLDYLLRLHLWKKLFLSAPKDLGITNEGQIFSTHEFITGSPPTQEETDRFLIECGLMDVKQQYWLWKKAYADFEIWVGDARADNFVKTDISIVPIDLRIWFMPPS